MSFWKTLSLLQKNLVWSILAFMALGVIAGYLFDASALKVLITPFTFIMVYPMMVTLNIKKVLSGGDTKIQIATQLLNFMVFPLVAFIIGSLFLADKPMLIVGLLLIALLPTSGMTISWTGFAKGNVEAAIKMTVIGQLAGAILAPFYLKYLAGTVMAIPLLSIFQQIVTIVLIPFVAGILTQKLLVWKYGQVHYQTSIKPKFPLLSTVGVFGTVFVAMALRSKAIIAEPSLLLALLAPLVTFYLITFILSSLIGRTLFNRNDAIALVYGTAMRNLSVALAIALTVFGEQGAEMALIIALAFVFQVPTAAWYLRIIDRLFGEIPVPGPQLGPQLANKEI